MTILDWVFVGALSLTLLSSLFFFLLLGFWLRNGKKEKVLKNKRPKNKRKRKKWLRSYRTIQKQTKRTRNAAVFLFIGTLILSGTAFYSRYYQSSHLGTKDTEAIAQSYLLLDSIEEQYKQIPDTDNPAKLQKNLYELAARLTSYGMRNADGRLSLEGQRLLNRMYASMKELGLNLSNQSVEGLKVQEHYESYQQDIIKTRDSQKKVLKFFSLNEKRLQMK